MTGLEYFFLASGLATLLMAIEAWASHRRARHVYTLGDTLSNLGCGLGQELFSALTAPFFAVALIHWQARFALVHWPKGSWAEVGIALVGSDLIYYGYHRLGHGVAAAWAIHEVHHQSEHFNFGVALRQSWLTAWAWAPLYPLLALVGVTPNGFMMAAAIMTLYQLFLHTTFFEHLGPIGWVLNTPAYHRVHHARDPRFFAPGAHGANFGAIFIVWDRIFGTFVECPQGILFGTAAPVPFLSPLRAQTRGWTEILACMREAPTLGLKVRSLFGAPAGVVQRVDAHRSHHREPFAPVVTLRQAVQGALLFALAAGATVYVEWAGSGLYTRLLAIGVAVAALGMMGQALDRSTSRLR